MNKLKRHRASKEAHTADRLVSYVATGLANTDYGVTKEQSLSLHRQMS